MILRDKTTKKEIVLGDTVKTFRGKPVTVVDMTGLIYVKDERGTQSGYFPSVINAEWVPEFGEES